MNDGEIPLDDGIDDLWVPDLLTPKRRPWTSEIAAGKPWDFEADLQERVAKYADELGLPNAREVTLKPPGSGVAVRLDHAFDVDGMENLQTLEVKRDVDGPRAGPTDNQKAIGIPDSPKNLDMEVRGESGMGIGLDPGDRVAVDVEYMNPVEDDIGGYIHDLAVRHQLGSYVDGNTAKVLSKVGHGASKALSVVGVVPTAVSMYDAAKESYDNGSVRPFLGQAVREGLSWGGGELAGMGGAALGTPAGGPIGSAAGYFVGSTLGGMVGYEVGDWIADELIWDDEEHAAPE